MIRHLLVIGGQRCGTTYLHHLLEEHPDIAMARPGRPEPKVFMDPDKAARGLDWYHQTYFSHVTTEQVLGEKSTSYIERPDAAPRAAKVLGAAEIVVLLRDPVTRAVSNWRFSTDNGFEDRPLAQALEENLRDAQPWDAGRTSVSPFAYLERGRFASFLQPWVDAFPGHLHLHFLQDLLDDDSALTRLYDDVGVDSTFRPEGLGSPVNQSEEPAPELDDDLVDRLREYFTESDRELARLVGRSLPWPSRA